MRSLGQRADNHGKARVADTAATQQQMAYLPACSHLIRGPRPWAPRIRRALCPSSMAHL